MDEKPTAPNLLTALLVKRELLQLLAARGVVPQLQLELRAGGTPTADEVTALFEELHVVCTRNEHAQRLTTTGSLAAGVVHEARNLLTGTLGFAQLLQSKAHDPAATLEMARLIESETRRCVTLLAGFLKLSASGIEPIKLLTTAELAEGVVRLVTHPLQQRECTLALALDDELPPVLGCAGELQRVLINLILNATAATGPGGHILLEAMQADDGCVELSVRDDGPGVPEALRERIFEPFFSTKGADQGTGLGLSLSRNIARSHRGELYLDAQNTTGAKFVLKLPAAEKPAATAGGEP